VLGICKQVDWVDLGGMIAFIVVATILIRTAKKRGVVKVS
jgi:hypothetical protein